MVKIEIDRCDDEDPETIFNHSYLYVDDVDERLAPAEC